MFFFPTTSTTMTTTTAYNDNNDGDDDDEDELTTTELSSGQISAWCYQQVCRVTKGTKKKTLRFVQMHSTGEDYKS